MIRRLWSRLPKGVRFGLVRGGGGDGVAVGCGLLLVLIRLDVGGLGMTLEAD